MKTDICVRKVGTTCYTCQFLHVGLQLCYNPNVETLVLMTCHVNSKFWKIVVELGGNLIFHNNKVKVTLEQATKAQRGCRGIALLFL